MVQEEDALFKQRRTGNIEKTKIIKWFLPGTVCTGSSYGYFAQRGGAWDAR